MQRRWRLRQTLRSNCAQLTLPPHPLPHTHRPPSSPPCCRCRCRYSGFRYGHPEGRILQFLLYARSSPDDNHYAHPLDTIIFYDFHTDK